MNDELDPALEDRLRAHFADRSARDQVPADGGPPQARPTRRWSRLAAVAAAVALVAGVLALTLPDDEPKETLDVVTSSSTTTTSATTTTAEATTTSRPPVASVRSVVVAVEGLLGWWDGSSFVAWTPGARVPATGGEVYDVVGIGMTPGTATGGTPEDGCQISEPPGVTIDVGLEYPEDFIGPPPIAVTGVADVLPRPAVEVAGDPTHVQAAAEVLATLGVDDDAPALAQVIRVDLEGDGVDELLVVAERLSDRATLYASPGDYSVLFLRQVVGGEVVTTVVAESVVPKDTREGEGFINLYRVSAIADLNGDGTMELMTRGVYYEGSGTAAHRVLHDGGVEQLFAVGCGA
ncbi:MAG: hypothetical protein ACRDYW_13375 [Acidimicrobiales bacterium]